MTTDRNSGDLFRLLAVFALLVIAFYFRAAPLSLDQVRETNTPEQFDTVRTLARLGRVLDGTPHPVDSEALQQTRTRLLEEIRAMGYVPEVHVHQSCLVLLPSGMRCAQVQNVFFRVGPATGPTLLLTAHYDSVDASPGFGDDGIGVGVWLEVAQLLRQTPPPQPVAFLFTDGEEMNLLGARAFANNIEDYDIEVARVINLEARGVSGPALMFETSRPNGQVVSDWSRSGARPFAHSMMAAVYELLPNSTDLTVHLDQGFPGINIAIAEGSDLYHSERDTLAELDPRSVQHMGDQALGAARAFMDANWSEDAASGDIVYADLLSRFFVVLPQTLAVILLIACFVVATVLVFRPEKGMWRRPDWRALVLPPLFFIGAGLLVFALQQLLMSLRGGVFWTASPQALNITVFVSVLFVAAVLVGFLASRSSRQVLFLSGTFWLLLFGVVITLAIPGFAMLFLIPALVLVVAGVTAHICPRFTKAAHVLASVVLVLHFFPVIHLVEVTLGLGTAAIFGVIEAFALAPIVALFHHTTAFRGKTQFALAAALIIASVITLLAPAYSGERPSRLNFMANYDLDEQQAVLFAAVIPGSLPQELSDDFVIGEFKSPPGFPLNLPARQLEYRSMPAASVDLTGEEQNAQGTRVITLRLNASGARGVRVTLPAGANPLRYRYEREVLEVSQPAPRESVVEIVGQSAHGAVVEITLASQQSVEVIVQGMWSTLPDEVLPIANQRPETSVLNRLGDQTITTRRQEL